MTLPLRRKPRTTARPTTPGRTACSLAGLALAGVLAAPAAAQPPGPPGAVPGYRLANPAPTGRPGQPPGAAPRQPPGQNRQLIAGPRNPAAEPAGTVRGGGRVMYFQKPADALSPAPNPDADGPGLAIASATAPGENGPATSPVPDIPAVPPVPALTTPRDLPLVPTPGSDAPPRDRLTDPTAPGYVPPQVPPARPPGYPTVPHSPIGIPLDGQPYTAEKKRQDLPKVERKDDPSVTRLPSRQAIFMMYNDRELEAAVVTRLKADIRARQEKPIRDDDGTWRFPDLTRIRNELAPPGTSFVAKTASYPPTKAVYEPTFVVHRRLHFEELNAERYGWDLGFIQPIVSTAYFYKDVLFWPNSLGTSLEVGSWDTSAGKCLPGSPVPYYLYPPRVTMTGLLFEGGIITGSAFILNPVNGAAPFVPAAAAP